MCVPYQSVVVHQKVTKSLLYDFKLLTDTICAGGAVGAIRTISGVSYCKGNHN